jgi:hypothetical protein
MSTRVGTKELTEQWKEKIQVSQIINVLNDHALGKNEMSMTRLKAADILLKKRLPDMKQVEAIVDASVTVIINKPS